MNFHPLRCRARTLVLSTMWCVVGCAVAAHAQPCEPMWIAGEPIPGVNGTVWGTTLWDRDGAGPAQPLIVVVGSFSIAGDQFAANVATFDTTTQRWSRCRDGVNGTARTCTSVRNAAGGEDLIVGGDFTLAGGVVVQNLARFDGARWHDVGGGVNASVRALAAMHTSATTSTLYVGGGFTTSATIPASYLVQWDGTTWSALGTGVNGRVNQLSVATNASGGQDLIVTGEFVWGLANSPVAVWSNGAWTQTPSRPFWPGPQGRAAIGWPRTGPGYDLIAGAVQETIFNTVDYYTMVWSGGFWQFMHGPSALLRSGHSAFAVVRQGAGRPALYSSIGSAVVRENGAGWTNAGVNVGANCMMPVPVTASTDDLIIGGSFRGFGGNNVLRHSSGIWDTLGEGLERPVTRLARIRDAAGSWRLVAAGRFRDPLVGTSCLAYSSGGSAWTWLGGLVSGEVRAMIVLPQASGPDHLLIAGDFTTIGGAPLAHLALWNGVSWSTVGSGSFTGGGPVCMTLHPNGSGGDDLIVGGTFTSIGSVAANRIARWDGTQWHAMGDGFAYNNTTTTPVVWAVASVPRLGGGADLYAGGGFEMSGTSPRSSICQWNGTSWDDLGSGLSGGRFPIPNSMTQTILINIVTAMEVVPRRSGGADLVVAGLFNRAGGIPVRRIARWDGSAWWPMGLGLGPVGQDILQVPNALAHMPNMQGGMDIFAAGMFTSADGLPARSIARWDGTQWHAVDGGFDNTVYDLMVVPGTRGRSELYAAGDFVQAGSVISCRVAIANCPTPMCKTDINGDMQVDFFDYVAFLSAFAEQADIADFNEDFTVDFFDYLDFAAGFSQGC